MKTLLQQVGVFFFLPLFSNIYGHFCLTKKHLGLFLSFLLALGDIVFVPIERLRLRGKKYCQLSNSL